MTREAFLQELNRLLTGVPDEERQELLADYEEHFYLAGEQGKTEEEIIRALGQPKNIARELLATYHVEQAESNPSPSSIARAALAMVSLGFFNLVFVLAPFMTLVIVLFALYVATFSMLVMPLLSLIKEVVQTGMSVSEFLFDLFVALVATSVGVLLLLGLLRLTKWLYRQLVRYLQFNLKIIKNKGDDK